MDRRLFLGLTLAAASTGPAIADVPRRLAAAARIGSHLLQSGAARPDPAWHRARLSAGARPLAGLFAEDWSAPIRADFAADRTVDAAGWALSETEVSLCVLAALEPEAAA